MKIYEEIEYLNKQSEMDSVTCLLLMEMNKACLKQQIKFIIIGLTNNQKTNEINQFCTKNNIINLPMNVDLTDTTQTFLPIDGHPNNLGHLNMAKRITKIINQFKN